MTEETATIGLDVVAHDAAGEVVVDVPDPRGYHPPWIAKLILA